MFRNRRFKWMMAFVAVALLVAGSYYLRPDHLVNQEVKRLSGARPDSRAELGPEALSNTDRSENARNAPPELATGDDATTPETKPAQAARPTDTPASSDADAYKRFGDITPEHLAWLKRNKYPDDAQLALLRVLDEASLRALISQGDLPAQSELAYRLSRNPATAPESANLFTDAIAKGSKDAIVRNAESLEQATGGCTNNVQGNAYLQVAAILGDLNAVARYSLCVSGMSPQDHALTLLLASKLFATLNSEALRRTGRPLQVDTHPLVNHAIDQLVTGSTGNGASGG